MQRLREQPEVLKNYDSIIREHLDADMIEQVYELETCNKTCYLPHQAVIRKDAETKKVQVIYDASGKEGKHGILLMIAYIIVNRKNSGLEALCFNPFFVKWSCAKGKTHHVIKKCAKQTEYFGFIFGSWIDDDILDAEFDEEIEIEVEEVCLKIQF